MLNRTGIDSSDEEEGEADINDGDAGVRGAAANMDSDMGDDEDAIMDVGRYSPLDLREVNDADVRKDGSYIGAYRLIFKLITISRGISTPFGSSQFKVARIRSVYSK
ncbi:hypothetical protein MPER_02147 [Moniliophthora perniciosa FA553]|nr:hypothetical protein MPER_02147 [Moniliophthora perniciosa FA553]